MVSASYLWIRDLGEHGGQALKQQHCSPAPQQELRWTHRLNPNHSLPLFLPAVTLPPLSFFLCLFFFPFLCLPACTGAVYRTGPQWPWVINVHYGADAFLPFIFVSYSVSLSCSSPTTLQEPKGTPVITTEGSSKLLHGGSNPALRVHQIINRPGVVYSQLILLGRGQAVNAVRGGMGSRVHHNVSMRRTVKQKIMFVASESGV